MTNLLQYQDPHKELMPKYIHLLGNIEHNPDLSQYQGLREDLMPEYFHLLVNIEQNPDFVQYAKHLAMDFFMGADFDKDPAYAQFPYSPDALDERMKLIYDAYVDQINKSSWLDTGIIDYPVTVGQDYHDQPIVRLKKFNTGSPFSIKVEKERLRQLAPFNLVDGAWLQRIQQAGPSDEVHAHLFEIWADEAGVGKVHQNHSNVYDALMRSLGFYLPPITSREFLSRDFLPSAFIGAVFQFCVSLFPEEFFPELLGMTLYLEWEATPTLTPVVRRLRKKNINPHFYSLHVAIDNITAGHGFLAKDGIKLFLAAKENEVGTSGVQSLWNRIWRGYVTWATLGDFGLKFMDLALAIDLKQIDLSYPIELTSQALTDIAGLHTQLTSTTPNKPSEFIHSRFRPETRRIIDAPLNSGSKEAIQKAVLAELNLLIQDEKGFYTPDRFQDIILGNDTQDLLDSDPSGEQLIRLNRLLLRDVYSGQIADIPTNIPAKSHPDYKSYFRARMVRLVKRKAYAAAPIHKGRILGGADLGELFSRSSELVDKLEKSLWINAQHSRDSRLLDLMEFNGQMYKIFTEEEHDILLDWIESLQPASGPHPPIIVDPLKAAVAMRLLIEQLAPQAKVEPSHQRLTFPDESGNPVELIQWFDNPLGLMAALKRPPNWIIPGNAEQSLLFSQFTGPMSILGADVIQTVREWIDSGAELPPEDLDLPHIQPFVRLDGEIKTSTLEFWKQEFVRNRPFIGMGTVH